MRACGSGEFHGQAGGRQGGGGDRRNAKSSSGVPQFYSVTTGSRHREGYGTDLFDNTGFEEIYDYCGYGSDLGGLDRWLVREMPWRGYGTHKILYHHDNLLNDFYFVSAFFSSSSFSFNQVSRAMCARAAEEGRYTRAQ